KHAQHIVRSLPLLSRALPRIARHKGFKQRTTDPHFRWQDQAYDLVCSLREHSVEQGFFGINMASTGCGKTLANGRIMYGLANPSYGARFSIALGLRTLTLQTGQAYRERLGLGDDDIGVLVGSAAVQDLFELANKQNGQQASESLQKLAACGSESAETLMPDNSYVHFEGSLSAGSLRKWLENNGKMQKLLASPILVSTIDHLIGATEAVRGGKQIAPMLRLLTSDLVLDEPDDFDMDDLPALTRLVHWAGMLGSRILLSSATLPPALIEGLFNAYQAGRTLFQKSRGMPGKAVNICCAWFDEHGAIASDHPEATGFMQSHQQFITKRLEKLRHMEIRRRAVIKPLDINNQLPIREQMANAIHAMAHELHRQHHSVDLHTGKRVSFGVVRMANIDPLIDVAKHLFKKGAQENHQIRLCCYHSRHPLLTRTKIEQQLDSLLNRKRTDSQFFANQPLREILNACREEDIIFMVLASPVTEVGRDHDYDWAIVEPSSMRSIIQLAGRVRRHRSGGCISPNLYLLNTNIKSLEQQGASYCKPGFEKETREGQFLLQSHDLTELLTPAQYEIISAEPRIQANKDLAPNTSLVDLEHARLQALMLAKTDEKGFPVCLWWQSQAMLTGFLQSKTPFRYDPVKQIRYALWLDEDEQLLRFFNLEGEQPVKVERILFELVELDLGERIRPWGNCDYLTLLADSAEVLDIDLITCGKRYGWVSLPQNKDNTSKWRYNPVLGLRHKDG
ncbi:MAG: CRISPR-associated protein, partial [Gammaproteobacteria bacterium]|nr:CRISPR-associated protein [Gammaproteobacteria bacterium]